MLNIKLKIIFLKQYLKDYQSFRFETITIEFKIHI